MSTQVYFGDHSLQSKIFNVTSGSHRNGAPIEIQRSPLSRTSGSVVVNSRPTEKEIVIRGVITKRNPVTGIATLNPEVNVFQSVNRLKNVLSQQNKYLRFNKVYTSLFSNNSTSGFVSLGDAQNLTVISYDSQIDNRSYSFDINAALSGSNFAGFANPNVPLQTFTGSILQDYPTKAAIEFFAYIPDVTYMDSIEVRYGSDASNYSYQRLKTNYAGEKLKTGWNLMSFYTSSAAGTQGTPYDVLTFDYLAIVLNYSTLQPNMSGILVCDFMVVKGDEVINFPAYLLNINIEGEHYENEFTRFEAKFLNYTGYGFGNQQTNLTSFGLNDTVLSNGSFVPEGSSSPLVAITLDLVNIDILTKLKFQNLSTSEQIEFSNNLPALEGQRISFGSFESYTPDVNGNPIDFSGVIPDYILNKNNFRLVAETTASVALSFLTNDNYRTGNGNTYRIAQSFNAPATGKITTLKLLVKGSFIPGGYEVYIESDSGGAPSGTRLGTGVIGANGLNQSVGQYLDVFGLDVSVTSGTKYWIILVPYYSLGGGISTSDVAKNIYWGHNSIGGLPLSGAAFSSTGLPGSWSLLGSSDQNFSLVVTPTPGASTLSVIGTLITKRFYL